MTDLPSFIGRIRRVAGALRRGLRSLLEGALHARRHRRSRLLVRSLQRPGHVLFLCLGNVCRSPYAEGRFRSLVAGDDGAPEAASAGFIGPGRPPPSGALDAATRRGVDTSAHTSRILTREMVERTDLVVVMDASQRRKLRGMTESESPPIVVLGDLDPDPVSRRSIRDPWGEGSDVFHEVFDRIDRCVGTLVDEIRDRAGDAGADASGVEGREASPQRHGRT